MFGCMYTPPEILGIGLRLGATQKSVFACACNTAHGVDSTMEAPSRAGVLRFQVGRLPPSLALGRVLLSYHADREGGLCMVHRDHGRHPKRRRKGRGIAEQAEAE